jgi:hypothetical protein
MGIRRWFLGIVVLALAAGLPVMPAQGKNLASGHRTTLSTLPPPAANPGWFGAAVAVSGNAAVVVPGDGPGEAFIYTEKGKSWSSRPVATLTMPAFAEFNTPVAISGPTIVLSDPISNPESVYVYSEGSGGWPTTPTVTETDPEWSPGDTLNDGFGQSLAVSGNTLLVGSANVDGNGDGVVYAYTEENGVWPTIPTQTLADPGASSTNASNDGFGEDVAVSGTTAMIGAYGSFGDGNPLVYAYTEESGVWPTSPTQTLVDPMLSNYCFGLSGLSISGTTALIGGGCDGPAKGVVYVYGLTQLGWWWPTPVATFHNPASERNSFFGTEEAVSGGTAVVGSWGYDDRRGRAYVYTRGENGVWDTNPTQVLRDPDGVAGDNFGYSLGLSGSTAIIGAPEGGRQGVGAGTAYVGQV